MLARRLVKRFKKNPTEQEAKQGFDRSGLVIPLLVIILLAAGIMQLLGTPERSITIPMLAQVDGFLEAQSTEELTTYTNTTFVLPEETFEATLAEMGVYATSNDLYPTDTVAIAYVRNGWRYMEINYKPFSIEEQLAVAGGRQISTVTLQDDIEGHLFSRQSLDQCIGSGTEEYPGKCEIDRQLFFPLGEIVVAISGTNKHITDGELIEIAKSILEQDSSETE